MKVTHQEIADAISSSRIKVKNDASRGKLDTENVTSVATYVMVQLLVKGTMGIRDTVDPSVIVQAPAEESAPTVVHTQVPAEKKVPPPVDKDDGTEKKLRRMWDRSGVSEAVIEDQLDKMREELGVSVLLAEHLEELGL